MGEEFAKKVDKIVELLESGEDSLYTYDEDKKIFKMFDKKRDINLTAKLEKNNFYFKDDISGKVYIFVKKYLNKNTTIQQILMDNGSDRCYCMFVEKNNDLELIKMVEKVQDEIMTCTNTNIINKSKEEIIQYMSETINNNIYIYIEHEEIDEHEYDEYNQETDEHNKENNEYNQEYDEYDEYNQETDELDNEQEDDEWGFDQEYDDEYDNDDIELQSEEEYNKLRNEKLIEEFFASYKVKYDNEEIEGKEKQEIVLETETVLDEYYYDSLTMNNVAEVLTETLKNMQKEIEHETR